MQGGDPEPQRPAAAVLVDIDSDEAIARQLHEMELERADYLHHEHDDSIGLAAPSRLFCINRRSLRLAYFCYLLLELAAVIPVMILAANEHYICEHSDLRVWIALWESRVVVALPLVAIKLCTRRRSFMLEVINAMLYIYILVLFFWGNLLLFSPGASTCYAKAPVSLAFVVAALVVVYAYLAVPLIIIALVCLCLPVYVLASTVVKRRPAPPDVDPVELAALPTRKFTKLSDSQGEPAKCAICMNDFVPEESTVTTLPCGHEFDRECIAYWLTIKRQCAICRQDIGQDRSPLESSGVEQPA